MSPGTTTTRRAADTLTERFPGPVPLAFSPAEANEQCGCDDDDDEEDQTDRQADFFAELLTA